MSELSKERVQAILRTITESNKDTLYLWEVTSLCNLALQGLDARAKNERLRETLTYIAKPLTRYDTAGDMQLIARTALEQEPKP